MDVHIMYYSFMQLSDGVNILFISFKKKKKLSKKNLSLIFLKNKIVSLNPKKVCNDEKNTITKHV